MVTKKNMQEEIILFVYKLMDCFWLSPWGLLEVCWRHLREAEAPEILRIVAKTEK